MQVAERVHVENVGETWRKAEILEETREHVPGVALQQTFEYRVLLSKRMYSRKGRMR